MAQTKRKRQTKHRGTPAGTIEARGRTGRKPTKDERKASSRELAARRREERLGKPPTWRGAFKKAAPAAILFLVASTLLLSSPLIAKVAISAFFLVFYVPLFYYTDLFVYRRHQKRRAQQTNKGAS